MPDAATSPKKVLFVDDNLQFLEMIERVMGEWSQGEWQIFLAQNSGKALLLLQEQAIDLAVVDIQMPVVDGIQFLALMNRKYPSVQKVTLSAYADAASRTACLNHGAELFLEKPRNPGDLEIIYSTLRELARQKQVTAGFRGVLRQVSLEDVIQMECLNRNSSILEIVAGKWTGRIYVKDGSLIHAEIGDRNGEAALNKILSLKVGDFTLKPFAEPSQQSIDGSWEFLLMEAARSRDEAAQSGADDSADSAEPTPEMPVPAPPVRAPQLAPAPTVSVPSQLANRPARIDELVVCSPKGEVLYEWKSGNANDRISFLEFLSQKSAQLGEGLNLGVFDRLEMEGERHRVIAQVKADRGIFIRATRAQSGLNGEAHSTP
ncbi:MAG: Response regulator receiver protein [Pedosphaera sp.]|nr:Response regulator receiver protein [Pedosphaera sp.]